MHYLYVIYDYGSYHIKLYTAMVYNQNYKCIYLHICYDIYTELTMILKTGQVWKRERGLFDIVRTQKWEEDNDIIKWSQNKVSGIPKTPVQVRGINSGATASA